MRPMFAGSMPTLVSRNDRNGRASFETSSGHKRASSSRDFGPAIAKPRSSVRRERIVTPLESGSNRPAQSELDSAALRFEPDSNSPRFEPDSSALSNQRR